VSSIDSFTSGPQLVEGDTHDGVVVDRSCSVISSTTGLSMHRDSPYHDGIAQKSRAHVEVDELSRSSRLAPRMAAASVAASSWMPAPNAAA